MIDGLIRIQNAYIAGHKMVTVRGSSFLYGVLCVLRREGYINGFKVSGRVMEVYTNRKGLGLRFKFLSRPGYRRVVSFKEVKGMYMKKRILVILSTSRGIFSVREIVKSGVTLGGLGLVEVELVGLRV